MISTSAQWKAFAKNGGVFRAVAEINYPETGYYDLLDTDDIMLGGVSVYDSICGDGAISVGSVVTNKIELKLNNTTGKFTDAFFRGAWLRLYFCADYSDTPADPFWGDEYIDRGVYRLENPQTVGSTIMVTGYDSMDLLNRYFTNEDENGNPISYPILASDLFDTIMNVCGNAGFWQLADFYIDEFEYDETCTFRQVLSWMLQVAGGYARCNEYGQCIAKPLIPSSSIYQIERQTIKDQSIGLETLAVTGVTAYVYNTVDEFDFATAGADGYVIAISDNPLITSANMQAVADRVWQAITGLQFHAFSINCIGDPAIEAGDQVAINSYSGSVFTTMVTDLTYQVGSERIACEAEPPEEAELQMANAQTQTVYGAIQAAYDYVRAKGVSADYITDGTMSGDIDIDTSGDISTSGVFSIGGNAVDDFVIAHGTSGNWTWRKWHSGIMEEWYRETKSSVAITSRSGSGYFATVTNGMSYPVAFLSGTYPAVQWSVQCDGGYGWIAPAYNYTNAYTGGAYIYSFSSVTKSFTYNIYAIGRWK